MPTRQRKAYPPIFAAVSGGSGSSVSRAMGSRNIPPTSSCHPVMARVERDDVPMEVKKIPHAIATAPVSAARMPITSKVVLGDATSRIMPIMPISAASHADAGVAFLATVRVRTRTKIVCVELRIAASPPGRRYAETNSIAWNRPILRMPRRIIRPSSFLRGNSRVMSSSSKPAGSTRISAAVKGRLGGRNSEVMR